MRDPFAINQTPDWHGLLRCIRRDGTPRRVHSIEVLTDTEIVDAVTEGFELADGLDRDDHFYPLRRIIALQRFLGYDYVLCSLGNFEMPVQRRGVSDTARLARASGRQYLDMQKGPVSSWDNFSTFPWPDQTAASTESLEWYEKNLPEDMCVIALGGFGHFAEHLSWLMGYQRFCVALYEQRDLVAAISQRLIEIYSAALRQVLQFDRVKVVWCADDMGFRNGPLVSPDDLREFALPGHKRLAEIAHAAGRPYMLHTCGNVGSIMEDLIEDVKIDAKHSFQDGVSDVFEAKKTYGNRIALLGGIDIDFLCRATEKEVRKRVRYTLEQCVPGGGYCLGTGNSVANYVPIDNYLAMLDEGRRFMA